MAVLSRMLIFMNDTTPTQQTLVDDLNKKYGSPSSDTGASQLNDANQCILVWFDDGKGNRIKAYKEHEAACLANSSFSSGNGSQGVDPVPIQTMEAGMRLEGRFVVGGGSVCQSYRMVQAGLQRCCQSQNILGRARISSVHSPSQWVMDRWTRYRRVLPMSCS